MLKAPFPWFGGKSRVAHLVWDRFGPVPNYVEPFAGSLAVLLGRPSPPRIETVNDIDCFLANFWRAVATAPGEVARWADAPVNEADLHARHLWLVKQEDFRERMKTDPDYYDARIAGWWVWGICCWIGSGWCSRPEWSGRINAGREARGVNTVQKMPNVTSGHGKGTGVHLRDSRKAGQQIWRKRPALKRGERGVHRQLPDLGGDGGASGRGVHASARGGLEEWMQDLADRLRRVRVCCGDWKRVLGRSPTECVGVTGIFLDPPYASERDAVYEHDSFTVAHEVREWAIENGKNPKLRIALCGYAGEHEMPEGWACVSWKANGGYGNAGAGAGRANATKERIWFSPHCLQARQEELL